MTIIQCMTHTVCDDQWLIWERDAFKMILNGRHFQPICISFNICSLYCAHWTWFGGNNEWLENKLCLIECYLFMKHAWGDTASYKKFLLSKSNSWSSSRHYSNLIRKTLNAIIREIPTGNLSNLQQINYWIVLHVFYLFHLQSRSLNLVQPNTIKIWKSQYLGVLGGYQGFSGHSAG